MLSTTIKKGSRIVLGLVVLGLFVVIFYSLLDEVEI